MSLQCLLFLVAASAFLLATAWRAAQTLRVVRQFPREVEPENDEVVEAVRAALQHKRVSFLVPAWNESTNLPCLMHDFAALSLPNLELLISAGGDDGTYDEAVRLSSLAPGAISVIPQKRGAGKQTALRELFERATGDVIYLVDADCRINDHIVAATLEPTIIGGETATTTFTRPLDQQMKNPVATALLAMHLSVFSKRDEYVAEISGANATCSADWIRSSGVFQHPAPVGTDVVMSRMLVGSGCRIRLVRNVWAKTEYALDLKSWMRQQSRWTRNAWFHDGKLPILGLLATASWWAVLLVGTLMAMPMSFLMVVLAVTYVYAAQPGVYLFRRVFKGPRLHHGAFVAMALLVQALPLIALWHHMDKRSRTRW